MSRRLSVLIVDDEPEILSITSAYLAREGYITRRAETGGLALEAIALQPPDLIVLDLMLPDMNGEDVCAQLRRRSNVPIIVLTARSAEASRLRALALGADDYLVKPFSPRELVGRIRAVLRRTATPAAAAADLLLLDEGRLELDLAGLRARLDGRELDLTPTEFRILAHLAQPAGRVRSRDELRSASLGDEAVSTERTVNAHVKNLRRKLNEARPTAGAMIRSVYGIGYRFDG